MAKKRKPQYPKPSAKRKAIPNAARAQHLFEATCENLEHALDDVIETHSEIVRHLEGSKPSQKGLDTLMRGRTDAIDQLIEAREAELYALEILQKAA